MQTFTYQPTVETFTAEYLLETVFDGEMIEQFSKHFVSVQEETEWGVEFVVMDMDTSEDTTCTYRLSNPTLDDDWQLGTITDVADALELQSGFWKEWLEN